jgi:recombination protein RecR
LVQQPGERLARLAAALVAVAERVRPCEECGNLAEGEQCEVCLDPRRDSGQICVVEEASGVTILERAGEFRGRYHVLGGHLDPLAGVGPEALHLDQLLRRVARGGVREVILATNPSMEGEVTATYVHQLLTGKGVKVTRLARGLPVGGDLEYVDGVTLAHALAARHEVG